VESVHAYEPLNLGWSGILVHWNWVLTN